MGTVRWIHPAVKLNCGVLKVFLRNHFESSFLITSGRTNCRKETTFREGGSNFAYFPPHPRPVTESTFYMFTFLLGNVAYNEFSRRQRTDHIFFETKICVEVGRLP